MFISWNARIWPIAVQLLLGRGQWKVTFELCNDEYVLLIQSITSAETQLPGYRGLFVSLLPQRNWGRMQVPGFANSHCHSLGRAVKPRLRLKAANGHLAGGHLQS